MKLLQPNNNFDKLINVSKEQLKKSFNVGAKSYKQFRLSYPAEIIEHIGRLDFEDTLKILDVGCGTGQSLDPFIGLNAKFICNDTSEDMLDTLRLNYSERINLDFLPGDFESLELPPEEFHLVLGGQSFHWLKTDLAIPKVFQILKPHGKMVLFWNFMSMDSSSLLLNLRSAIESIARNYIYWPDYGKNNVLNYKNEWLDEINSKDLFDKLTHKILDWTVEISPSDYINWVKTFSWFKVLDISDQRRLIEKLYDVFPAEIQSFDLNMTTLLIVATK